MGKTILLAGSLLLISLMCLPAAGFMTGGGGEGCGAGECKDCHSLSVEEASKALQGVVDEVTGVQFSEVGGLWEIDVVTRGRRIPLYMDYSKQYIISGQVVKIATRENLTDNRLRTLNTVDVSGIPLEDAVIVGDKNAAVKIIVFDDPVCPFCKKLHDAMNEVVTKDPGIAFYIKMFPLTKIHPDAYQKAKAIVCEKSLQLLEISLSGGKVPAPTCETDLVDKNIALAETLGIRTTPTLILPNGLVVPGYRDAEGIRQLLSGEAGKSAPQ